MTLRVDEDDERCPFIAGMEDITVDQVLRKRDCTLTNKSFPFQSFRQDPNSLCFPHSVSKEEALARIFHGGRLVCRVVYIRHVRQTGKDNSGIVRHLYSNEVDHTNAASPSTEPELSGQISLPIEDNEDDGVVIVTGKRRARSNSLEIFDTPPKKRKQSLPAKKHCYTFADVFCGVGGATQGAVQAGLNVRYGLDNDETAIDAYHLNHPGALPFCQNAHHFPPSGFTTSDLRVDVLHLSPPCCYWSPAQ